MWLYGEVNDSSKLGTLFFIGDGESEKQSCIESDKMKGIIKCID